MKQPFFPDGRTSSPAAPSSLVRIVAVLCLFLLPALTGGCGLFFGSEPVEQRYSLDYPSPAFNGAALSNAVLTVRRFTAAEQFRDPSMIYSRGKFERNDYNDSRWDAAPGDMVTDFLVRDLRNADAYRAVFSRHDDEAARFVLQGVVDNFLEKDEEDGQHAVLALTVSLLDRTQQRSARVILQKTYRAEEVMENRTPKALAGGLSRAMETLSAKLQRDVYNAVEKTDSGS